MRRPSNHASPDRRRGHGRRRAAPAAADGSMDERTNLGGPGASDLAGRTLTGRDVVVCVVVTLLGIGVLVRSLGIWEPFATSSDEVLHCSMVRKFCEAEGTWDKIARFDMADLRFLPQVLAARVLAAGVGPLRAPFVLAAVIGLLSLAALAGAARGVFGRSAGWMCLVLGTLSVVQANFTVKVLGVIHAYGVVCLALLAFASGRRLWWAVGGVLLGIAFLLHYNAGLVAVGLAVGCLASDALQERRIGGLLKRFVAVRLWVAAPSAGVLVVYYLLLRMLAGKDYFERLASHEVLRQPHDHGPLYWLGMLWHLDPVLFFCGLGAALLVLLLRRHRGLGRALLACDGPCFLTPAAMTVGAISIAIIYCSVQSLSGMARQLFLAYPMWLPVLSAIAAEGWGGWAGARPTIRRWRDVAAAGVLLAGTAGLLAAGVDLHATRNVHPATGELLRQISRRWPQRKLSVTDYFDLLELGPDSEDAENPFDQLGRPPDLIVGAPRFFPFPVYEEQPFKLSQVRRILERGQVDEVLGIEDVVYTYLVWTWPALSVQENRDLREGLSVGQSLRVRAPSGASFAAQVLDCAPHGGFNDREGGRSRGAEERRHGGSGLGLTAAGLVGRVPAASRGVGANGSRAAPLRIVPAVSRQQFLGRAGHVDPAPPRHGFAGRHVPEKGRTVDAVRRVAPQVRDPVPRESDEVVVARKADVPIVGDDDPFDDGLGGQSVPGEVVGLSQVVEPVGAERHLSLEGAARVPRRPHRKDGRHVVSRPDPLGRHHQDPLPIGILPQEWAHAQATLPDEAPPHPVDGVQVLEELPRRDPR